MPGHLTDGHPQTPKSIRSHLSFCDVSVIIDDAERTVWAVQAVQAIAVQAVQLKAVQAMSYES